MSAEGPRGETAVTADRMERLSRLDSGCVSDAMDRLSLPGVLVGFRRWGCRSTLAGRLRTLLLEPGPTPAGSSHLGTRLLATAASGDVVLVANAGRVAAGAWGGLLTLEARGRGVVGIIVDGALRDADEIDGLDVAVFARAPTPRTARGRYREAGTDVPVVVDTVPIRPPGLVIADGSGVVIVPESEAERVLAISEEIAREEVRMAQALAAGRAGVDVMDAGYERLIRG